jgi:hypothetical protein
MKDNENDTCLEFYRQMFFGSWVTQGIGVAAELGIADLLSTGPQTAEELAEKTGSHSESLYRVLRALASIGIFCQDEMSRFSPTPLSSLLRSDYPGTQRAFATMMGGEFHAAWGELLHSVQTGEPGFNKRYGMPFFQYMTDQPVRHGIYDAAMTGVHGGETGPMLDAYDFGAFKKVADIGGGNGLTLAAILEKHPSLHGILFDLPAVTDRARSTLQAFSSGDRMRVEGGNFFESVPHGADAYVLRHIIHDWQDPEATTILRKCRDAMAPDGKVLVVEMVITPGNDPGFGKWLDLMMLLVAGRERTEEEYGRLFSAAGLKMTRVIPTSTDVSIIEGVPRP